MLEGLSFLLLLGVAMPLKYMWGMPVATKVAGMIHGLLFIAYVVMAKELSDNESWTRKKFALALGAAVLPFGPFVFDKKYLDAK